MRRPFRFLSELFRRKVVRVLFAYVAMLWVLSQGFADLFPAFGFPDWSLRAFIVAGVAAIPIFALLSWKYDLTPPRIVRDPQDVEDARHPAISWAMRRHEEYTAGQIVLRWKTEREDSTERCFHTAVTIGRGLMNDIHLSDRRVSRHHAVLWAENGSWHVRDLDSANGTFVDGARITGSTPLPQSCELRFHFQGPVVDVSVDQPPATLVP